MQTRRLGNSDLELTTVGLGTWAIGGGDWRFGWGDQDEHEAVAAIVRAIDLGINWIDTAAVYGGGRSEEIVCRALQQIEPSRRPLVATKCGRVMRTPDIIDGVLKRKSILAECEASLRRLGLETIDLYQIHWPLPDEDIEEAWSTLVQLKQQGKVRHIGVSNHNVRQMERLQAIHPIASLQPPYSMIVRDIERSHLPYCAEQKVGVICYSPMCKGLLTGRFTAQRAAVIPDNDHRSRDPKFQPPMLDANLRLVAQLEPVAQSQDRTMAELAIAWVLRRPEICAAIVGARRPEQIEQTARAADWTLPDDVISTIEVALAEHHQTVAGLEMGRV